MFIKRSKLFKNKKNILTIVIILLIHVSCATNKKAEHVSNDSFNFDHFNHLYKEIDFNGEEVGIVHIYSE